ncbi:hypothetical protein I4U23_027477 [Adineta vaga]|nr:hypothetical protein I4U23_027477 [Adineta vaga]
MLRSPRVKNAPHKYSPSQPTLYSQENYLLRFEDNNELVVVKRSSIRSIIEDKAIVGTGSKRRFATIEAKGTYTECNNMYEYLKGEEENDDDDEENQINDQEEEDDDQMNESKSPDAIPKEPIVTKKRKLSSLIVEDNDGKYIEEEYYLNSLVKNITSSKTQKDVSKKKTSKCFHDDFKYKYNVLHLESDRLSDNSIVRNDVLVNQNQNNEENETIQTNTIGFIFWNCFVYFLARLMYQTIDDMHQTILQRMEKKFSNFTRKLDQLIPCAVYQNLDSYREKNEVFPTTVMYKDKNLLESRGRDIYDFGRQVLGVLYTPEELSSSILPPDRSHLARPALDPQRFGIFHGM